jgi:hypothetical protein
MNEWIDIEKELPKVKEGFCRNLIFWADSFYEGYYSKKDGFFNYDHQGEKQLFPYTTHFMIPEPPEFKIKQLLS